MTSDKYTKPEASGLVAHDETRLQGGRVICLQPKAGYRTAIDPVFLAASVGARPGDRVLDAGAGTGAAALCLAARVTNVHITGIEIQPKYAALARQSAVLNGWTQNIDFLDGDLSKLPTTATFREFDHVMTNPPYMEAGSGRVSPDREKAMAHAESHVSLSEWLSICIRATRSRGTVTIIHRADRLEEIMSTMAGKLGHIVVFPLWSTDDKNRPEHLSSASRVVVCGRKGVNSPGQLTRGMRLHENDNGSYTPEASSILSGGGSLALFD